MAKKRGFVHLDDEIIFVQVYLLQRKIYGLYESGFVVTEARGVSEIFFTRCRFYF